MCHIGCPFHGQQFKDKIPRLKSLGAPVAEVDLAPAFHPIRRKIVDYSASLR